MVSVLVMCNKTMTCNQHFSTVTTDEMLAFISSNHRPRFHTFPSDYGKLSAEQKKFLNSPLLGYWMRLLSVGSEDMEMIDGFIEKMRDSSVKRAGSQNLRSLAQWEEFIDKEKPQLAAFAVFLSQTKFHREWLSWHTDNAVSSSTSSEFTMTMDQGRRTIRDVIAKTAPPMLNMDPSVAGVIFKLSQDSLPIEIDKKITEHNEMSEEAFLDGDFFQKAIKENKLDGERMLELKTTTDYVQNGFLKYGDASRFIQFLNSLHPTKPTQDEQQCEEYENTEQFENEEYLAQEDDLIEYAPDEEDYEY